MVQWSRRRTARLSVRYRWQRRTLLAPTHPRCPTYPRNWAQQFIVHGLLESPTEVGTTGHSPWPTWGPTEVGPMEAGPTEASPPLRSPTEPTEENRPLLSKGALAALSPTHTNTPTRSGATGHVPWLTGSPTAVGPPLRGLTKENRPLWGAVALAASSPTCSDTNDLVHSWVDCHP